MISKLELLIAWRYLGAQRKSLFVSLIGIFSMLGVSIGVFALVVALAAVNGFEEEVTAQMIGKDAHFCCRFVAVYRLQGGHQLQEGERRHCHLRH